MISSKKEKKTIEWGKKLMYELNNNFCNKLNDNRQKMKKIFSKKKKETQNILVLHNNTPEPCHRSTIGRRRSQQHGPMTW